MYKNDSVDKSMTRVKTYVKTKELQLKIVNKHIKPMFTKQSTNKMFIKEGDKLNRIVGELSHKTLRLKFKLFQFK